VRPRGPDFLAIGAQRSGTTWLHAVLSQHPQLWLAPVKELHYFDKLHLRRTLLDAHERGRVGFSGLAQPGFALRYWLGARNDAWYGALFAPAQRRGAIAGEITPAYAAQSEAVFRRIHAVAPHAKLVFVMRDPIARAWSALNHAHEKRGGEPGALPLEEALARARRPAVAARSAYDETIQRLEAVFPAAQLHFAFFDGLREDPRRFTTDLLAFLGADPAHAERLRYPASVNAAARSTPVPPALARALAEEYLPMVRALAARFGGAPDSWRERYEALLVSA
jgi:hypothetical protein